MFLAHTDTLAGPSRCRRVVWSFGGGRLLLREYPGRHATALTLSAQSLEAEGACARVRMATAAMGNTPSRLWVVTGLRGDYRGTSLTRKRQTPLGPP